jgi:hypothetical protein
LPHPRVEGQDVQGFEPVAGDGREEPGRLPLVPGGEAVARLALPPGLADRLGRVVRDDPHPHGIFEPGLERRRHLGLGRVVAGERGVEPDDQVGAEGGEPHGADERLDVVADVPLVLLVGRLLQFGAADLQPAVEPLADGELRQGADAGEQRLPDLRQALGLGPAIDHAPGPLPGLGVLTDRHPRLPPAVRELIDRPLAPAATLARHE